MNIYVGIDQSINSTGITVNIEQDEFFYIITGNNKLTAREMKANNAYDNFQYIMYNKINTKESKDNHESEIIKTHPA